MNTQLNQYLVRYFPHLKNQNILSLMTQYQQEICPHLSTDQACEYFILNLVRVHKDYQLDFLWHQNQQKPISQAA